MDRNYTFTVFFPDKTHKKFYEPYSLYSNVRRRAHNFRDKHSATVVVTHKGVVVGYFPY